MSRVPFVDLHPGPDAGDVRAAIDRVLASGWFILGPELEAFEAEFAAACGARHAVGVASGTDAITLLLRASGIGPGDAVIVPALTAAFTGTAVVAAGATPVIADVEPDTLTLAVRACEAAHTARTRAIVPVHLYGHPAALDPLRDFASRHALVLVEDCCQAHLATYRARPVGTGGAGGAFSFYPTKNLGALGDGGAIVTNDASIAERVRILRNGGQVRRHEHAEAGMNSRLDELQAAVLRARLLHLSAWTARRREIGQFYRAHLPRTVAPLPERDPGHVYHLFPVRSSRRDALRESLGGAGIDTLVHYPRTLGSQPAFAAYGPASCPEAERAAGELVSLPLHPRLTDDQARAVVDAVGRFTP